MRPESEILYVDLRPGAPFAYRPSSRIGGSASCLAVYRTLRPLRRSGCAGCAFCSGCGSQGVACACAGRRPAGSSARSLRPVPPRPAWCGGRGGPGLRSLTRFPGHHQEPLRRCPPPAGPPRSKSSAASRQRRNVRGGAAATRHKAKAVGPRRAESEILFAFFAHVRPRGARFQRPPRFRRVGELAA